MTKQELIAMMGNEDRAKWVMDRVLEAVKPDFVVAVLKAKADAAKQILQDKEESGYYTEFNEFPADFNYWGASEEMQQRYDQNSDREYERCGDKKFATLTENMWVHAVNNVYKVK